MFFRRLVEREADSAGRLEIAYSRGHSRPQWRDLVFQNVRPGSARGIAAGRVQTIPRNCPRGQRDAIDREQGRQHERAHAAADRGTAGAPVQYALPPNWQEKPLSPMRLASFKAIAPNGKEADISVVSLPGSAGGDLANVNRWRGQVKLGPIDADALKRAAEHIKANGHAFLLVDLVSDRPIGDQNEKQRILAAILDENDYSWFIKMTGEDQAVVSQKRLHRLPP